MKRRLYEKRTDQRTSIAVSIAVHVVVAVLIASITFRYPLSAFFSAAHEPIVEEHVQYVKVMPQPGGGGPKAEPRRTETKPPPPKQARPEELFAPSTIPTALPPVPPPEPSEVSGTGSGRGAGVGSGSGMAAGLEPALPDPRIHLRPTGRHFPLSVAERNDSAVKAIFMAFREAEIAAEANRGRNPRDWTVEHNGQKYGLDSQYIYLGKFKLPSAILAALPFNYGGVDGTRIIRNRNATWIQNDIYMHAQGLSEEDFRAAVKRIRERKDREKREAQERAGKTSTVP